MNLTDREHPYRFFLDNLWLWKTGNKEVELNRCTGVDYNERKDSIQPFLRGMENRILVGAYRYEYRGTDYDYKKLINHKLNLYIKTGNSEFLIDVANYAWLVFMYDKHSNKHFAADNSETNKEPLKGG